MFCKAGVIDNRFDFPTMFYGCLHPVSNLGWTFSTGKNCLQPISKPVWEDGGRWMEMEASNRRPEPKKRQVQHGSIVLWLGYHLQSQSFRLYCGRGTCISQWALLQTPGGLENTSLQFPACPLKGSQLEHDVDNIRRLRAEVGDCTLLAKLWLRAHIWEPQTWQAEGSRCNPWHLQVRES